MPFADPLTGVHPLAGLDLSSLLHPSGLAVDPALALPSLPSDPLAGLALSIDPAAGASLVNSVVQGFYLPLHGLGEAYIASPLGQLIDPLYQYALSVAVRSRSDRQRCCRNRGRNAWHKPTALPAGSSSGTAGRGRPRCGRCGRGRWQAAGLDRQRRRRRCRGRRRRWRGRRQGRVPARQRRCRRQRR